jgi:hypothetical protein
MLKKYLSIALITSIVCTFCGVTAFANSKGDSEAQRIEKVKNDIRDLGVGPDALLKLKLRDKTKLEGYISAVAEDTFEVTDLRTGVATTVAYPQVGKAKRNNLSDGARTAIFVGLAVGLTILSIKYGRRGRRRF